MKHKIPQDTIYSCSFADHNDLSSLLRYTNHPISDLRLTIDIHPTCATAFICLCCTTHVHSSKQTTLVFVESGAAWVTYQRLREKEREREMLAYNRSYFVSTGQSSINPPFFRPG
mmetsp:Transcript_4328/g.6872  ORF Transcript_4328/g.6872 Transcript_4328/m.6872 type:complete len:115 (+) Transcript_4328:1559-1903(+)